MNDPFRALENVGSSGTQAWIAAEKRLAAEYFDRSPERARIRAELQRLDAYSRTTIPVVAGGRYFFRTNTGLQSQDVLASASSPAEPPSLLIDPNQRWPDGRTRLVDEAVAPDGRYVAYATAASGREEVTWNIWDVAARADGPDHVEHAAYSSLTWRGSRGFYYGRFTAGEGSAAVRSGHAVYYHALGTPQSADRLIYRRSDRPEWLFDTALDADGRYLIVTATAGAGPARTVFAHRLDAAPSAFEPLIGGDGASYTFVGGMGSTLWFLTDSEAPRRRIVSVDVEHPATVRTVVGESEDTIRQVALAGGSFVVSYVHDAHSVLRRFGLDGRSEGDVPLPDIGSVGALSGSLGNSGLWFTFSTFSTPQEVLRYDLASGTTTAPFRTSAAPNAARYVTEQIFVTEKSGMRVPMFVSRRRDVRLTPQTPAVLTGYGGFGVSMLPSYSVVSAEWMDLGGIYVTANVRGGGEYGEAWHRAAVGVRKQQSIDDFVACAEWLIAHRYTSRPKLAAAGISNGALLVAGALTQRPDIFGAAVPINGVFDMLRFDRFTVGRAWTGEYGSPQDEQQFKALLAYSPLHHVRAGTAYPATLVIAAEDDERVFPAHSYKFAAALQAAQSARAPVLIEIRSGEGHDPAARADQFLDELADAFAFLRDALHAAPSRHRDHA